MEYIIENLTDEEIEKMYDLEKSSNNSGIYPDWEMEDLCDADNRNIIISNETDYDDVLKYLERDN